MDTTTLSAPFFLPKIYFAAEAARESKRPQYSYFRYGLDWIRDIVLHPSTQWLPFRQIISQLIPVQPVSPEVSC